MEVKKPKKKFYGAPKWRPKAWELNFYFYINIYMKGKKLLVLETKEYRIVSFGLDGAGKSSLIKSYLKEEGEIH